MRNEAQIKADIDYARNLVNSAVVNHSGDGVSNTFDLRVAKERLAVLENELAALQGQAPKRPRLISIKLS